MRTGRWSVSIAVLLMVGLLAAGCGSGSGESNGPNGTDERLSFYDWEANVRGPARIIGASQEQPRVAGIALADLARRWSDAGRPVTEGTNRALINLGAEPTLAAAESLESRVRRSGRAPDGTVILSYQATGPDGRVLPGTKHRGYFVFNDDPALTRDDIRDPRAGEGLLGQPVVTFEFTPQGLESFQRLTDALAKRGRDRCLSGCPLVIDPESFAITWEDRILDRTELNFIEYPDGMDGRTGYQTNGGLTRKEAQSIADAIEAAGG